MMINMIAGHFFNKLVDFFVTICQTSHRNNSTQRGLKHEVTLYPYLSHGYDLQKLQVVVFWHYFEYTTRVLHFYVDTVFLFSVTRK